MECFWTGICILKKDVDFVKQFLESQNQETCEKFIYYACTGEKLKVDEYHDYEFTWLRINEV